MKLATTMGGLGSCRLQMLLVLIFIAAAPAMAAPYLKTSASDTHKQIPLDHLFRPSQGLIGPLFRQNDHSLVPPSKGGCYYQFRHYDEGDRIITNEPCLNCTCHNSMLMCYLKVCPFSKPIGQDCTVEKSPDQCCPVITCPQVSDTKHPVQVPVNLQVMHMASSTTLSPVSTAVGHVSPHGCNIQDEFYEDGAQVPGNPLEPCELCYCIRNSTACLMQECTLKVQGCEPVFANDICCPVRYKCEYDQIEDMTTTTMPSNDSLLTTTMLPTSTDGGCVYEGDFYADGALLPSVDPCEHCYCMKSDIVCAVQECRSQLDEEDENCIPRTPPPGKCCPEAYDCPDTPKTTVAMDGVTTILPDIDSEGKTESVPEVITQEGEDPTTTYPAPDMEVTTKPEQEMLETRTTYPDTGMTTEPMMEDATVKPERTTVETAETTDEMKKPLEPKPDVTDIDTSDIMSDPDSDMTTPQEEVRTTAKPVDMTTALLEEDTAVTEKPIEVILTGEHELELRPPVTDLTSDEEVVTTSLPSEEATPMEVTDTPEIGEPVDITTTKFEDEVIEDTTPSEADVIEETTISPETVDTMFTLKPQVDGTSTEQPEEVEVETSLPQTLPGEVDPEHTLLDTTSEIPIEIDTSDPIVDTALPEATVAPDTEAVTDITTESISDMETVTEAVTEMALVTEPVTEADISCNVNGTRYEDQETVPISKPCHDTCVCKIGIVSCQHIACPSPPPVFLRCNTETDSSACCPSYECPVIEPEGTPSPNCLLDDKQYLEGDYVPSQNLCTDCYCLYGEVICASQECPDIPKNCKATVLPLGECCPDKYECDELEVGDMHIMPETGLNETFSTTGDETPVEDKEGTTTTEPKDVETTTKSKPETITEDIELIPQTTMKPEVDQETIPEGEIDIAITEKSKDTEATTITAELETDDPTATDMVDVEEVTTIFDVDVDKTTVKPTEAEATIGPEDPDTTASVLIDEEILDGLTTLSPDVETVSATEAVDETDVTTMKPEATSTGALGVTIELQTVDEIETVSPVHISITSSDGIITTESPSVVEETTIKTIEEITTSVPEDESTVISVDLTTMVSEIEDEVTTETVGIVVDEATTMKSEVPLVTSKPEDDTLLATTMSPDEVADKEPSTDIPEDETEIPTTMTEGCWWHDLNVYEHGDQVPSIDECKNNCRCINGVVKCDIVNGCPVTEIEIGTTLSPEEEITKYDEITTLMPTTSLPEITSKISIEKETVIPTEELIDETESVTTVGPDVEIKEPTATDQPGIPGEGLCISNGTTYDNEELVPVSSPCQTECRCRDSVISCGVRACSPPPPAFLRCAASENLDECCPSYNCPDADSTVEPSPNCIRDGQQYYENDYIPSLGICTDCYCIGGEAVCATLECPKVARGCMAVETRFDECCPSKYECPEDSFTYETTTVFTDPESPVDIQTDKPIDIQTDAPTDEFEVTTPVMVEPEESMTTAEPVTTGPTEDQETTTRFIEGFGIDQVDEMETTVGPAVDIGFVTTVEVDIEDKEDTTTSAFEKDVVDTTKSTLIDVTSITEAPEGKLDTTTAQEDEDMLVTMIPDEVDKEVTTIPSLALEKESTTAVFVPETEEKTTVSEDITEDMSTISPPSEEEVETKTEVPEIIDLVTTLALPEEEEYKVCQWHDSHAYEHGASVPSFHECRYNCKCIDGSVKCDELPSCKEPETTIKPDEEVMDTTTVSPDVEDKVETTDGKPIIVTTQIPISEMTVTTVSEDEDISMTTETITEEVPLDITTISTDVDGMTDVVMTTEEITVDSYKECEWYDSNTYQHGEPAPSFHECRHNCKCMDGSVKCEDLPDCKTVQTTLEPVSDTTTVLPVVEDEKKVTTEFMPEFEGEDMATTVASESDTDVDTTSASGIDVDEEVATTVVTIESEDETTPSVSDGTEHEIDTITTTAAPESEIVSTYLPPTASKEPTTTVSDEDIISEVISTVMPETVTDEIDAITTTVAPESEIVSTGLPTTEPKQPITTVSDEDIISEVITTVMPETVTDEEAITTIRPISITEYELSTTMQAEKEMVTTLIPGEKEEEAITTEEPTVYEATTIITPTVDTETHEGCWWHDLNVYEHLDPVPSINECKENCTCSDGIVSCDSIPDCPVTDIEVETTASPVEAETSLAPEVTTSLPTSMIETGTGVTEIETEKPAVIQTFKECFWKDSNTYSHGQSVPSIDECQADCKCNEGVVKCNRVACPVLPPAFFRCETVAQNDSCCPVYDCAIPETTDRCRHKGEDYFDGDYVPSPDLCTDCYCLGGEVVCAQRECGIPRDNCIAVETRADECCPEVYQCVEDVVKPEDFITTTMAALNETIPEEPGKEDPSSVVSPVVPPEDIQEDDAGMEEETTPEEPFPPFPGMTPGTSDFTTTVTPSPVNQTTTWSPSSTTDLILGPGSCLFDGKVYVSAQQIPRDDPCDFCFCFRGDIICLQQTCPPPIPNCFEEAIPGFCCPRYECPVNKTITEVTTTTPSPIPGFPPLRKTSRVAMCEIEGQSYAIDEVVTSASGPCLECRCGHDASMKCLPIECGSSRKVYKHPYR